MKEIIKNMLLRQIGVYDRVEVEKNTLAMLNKGYIGEKEFMEVSMAIEEYYRAEEIEEVSEEVFEDEISE